ncbi:uncharacterized protein LOC106172096 [Lingula anatina]|uniref:Uncharacterized protein LOC106172096 n=1 Tax=Lingula anatina TaxID=7574 RepID=A0A1S3JCU6_LINAN|nr:uncharacterized protein LOC106172096 [Lingula anatina]|eukprot:XP_013408143.1 uncharacterized protein LOC106172096 [Lingula anatina]
MGSNFKDKGILCLLVILGCILEISQSQEVIQLNLCLNTRLVIPPCTGGKKINIILESYGRNPEGVERCQPHPTIDCTIRGDVFINLCQGKTECSPRFRPVPYYPIKASKCPQIETDDVEILTNYLHLEYQCLDRIRSRISLNQPCELNLDRCKDNNAHCDPDFLQCRCVKGYFAKIINGNPVCVPHIPLNGLCAVPDICNSTNAECRGGRCRCKPDFYEKYGSCGEFLLC